MIKKIASTILLTYLSMGSIFMPRIAAAETNTETTGTGTIVIHKTIINPQGGTETTDGTPFTVFVDNASQTVTQSTPAIFNNIAVGTHTISETLVVGYVTSAILPNQVNVTNGSTTDVTIINTRTNGTGTTPGTSTTAGKLILEKQSNGGTGTFMFNLGGLGSTTSRSITTTASGVVGTTSFDITSNFGEPISITEPSQSGWNQTSASCSINGSSVGSSTTNGISVKVWQGQTVTCRIINERQAQVTIIKQTVNGTGKFHFSGLGTSTGFDLDTTGTSGAHNSQTFYPSVGQNGSTYSISESPQNNWKLTSVLCTQSNTSNNSNTNNNINQTNSSGITNPTSLTVNPGDQITCTFTNTKTSDTGPGTSTPQGNLIIKTIVNNSGRGTAMPNDFTFYVTKNLRNINGSPSEGSSAGVGFTVEPGTYNIRQKLGPLGYFRSFSGDCDWFGRVTIQQGETKTCTITNEDFGF